MAAADSFRWRRFRIRTNHIPPSPSPWPFQISLIGKTLAEAQQIIKCGHVSGYTNLTIEYDVSVVQSVEFSMGPLLIEIERPMNDKLGLVLCNYTTSSGSSSAGTSSSTDKIDEVSQSGIYIASILPASIADR